MTDSKDERRTYSTLAIVFLPLGVVLGLTTENWTIGLPFLVLAMTFLVLGMKPAKKPESSEDDAG